MTPDLFPFVNSLCQTLQNTSTSCNFLNGLADLLSPKSLEKEREMHTDKSYPKEYHKLTLLRLSTQFLIWS